MANHESLFRTNYFRVRDEELWKRWFGCIGGAEDFSRVEDGVTWHAFGGYGSPWFSFSSNNEECDGDILCDMSVAMIQEFIAEDDAFIYMESGHEKLRYVSGYSVVITSEEMDMIDIANDAVLMARRLLGNSEYTTRTDY